MPVRHRSLLVPRHRSRSFLGRSFLGRALIAGLLLAATPAGALAASPGPMRADPVGGSGAASPSVATAQDAAPGWDEVLLIDGFQLDLATFQLIAGGQPEEGLLFEDGQLIAQPRLRTWTPLEMSGPASLVHKSGGDAVDQPVPLPGDEYLYDLGADRWGYLHVLDRRPDAIRVEVVRAAAGTDVLQRDPARVRAVAEPTGHRVSWTTDDPAARYAVQRWVRGDEAGFVELARVVGNEYVDRGAPSGRVVEYRVGRVQEDDDAPAFGARGSVLRSEQPEGWPTELSQGQHLDLLSGRVVSSAEAHLEITLVQPPTLMVRTANGAALYGPERPGARGAGAWTAPYPWEKGYQEDVRRSLRGEQTCFASLPDGTIVRLEFAPSEQGFTLRRQVDLTGRLDFPRPPEPPEFDWDAEGLSLVFPDLDPAILRAQHASLVIEIERTPGDQVWEELVVAPTGQRTIRLGTPWDADRDFLVRVRARHRLPGIPDSPAHAPVEVLTFDVDDPAELNRAIDGALRDLDDGEFVRRKAARLLLVSLGDLAWPRLEGILTGRESASVEVQAVVREQLLDDPAGRSLPLVLRARAAEEGVDAPPPTGVLDVDPTGRALGLLRAHGGPAARAWSRVLMLSDADPALRVLGELLHTDGEPPAPIAPGGTPLALVPPAARVAPSGRDWRWAVEEGDPVEVAAWVRAALDPYVPRAADVAWMVADRLEEAGAPWSAHGDLQQRAELALRLVDVARTTGDSTLLDAAEALVRTPALRLRSQRAVLDLRSSGAAPVRERFVLETADLSELTSLLSDLRDQGKSYVDVVLPAGVYEDQNLGPWFQIHIDGLRLIGEPGVVLRFGFQLEGVQDVVLEDLAVESPQTSALLMRDGASASVRGCRLVGRNQVLSIKEARLELDDCHVDQDPAVPAPFAVRMTGGGDLRMRRCFVTAGSLRLDTGDRIYLDRCLVDAGGRVLAQGNMASGVIVARACLLRGRAQGFLHLAEVVLESVALDLSRDLMINVPGATVCPATVRTIDPDLAWPEGAVLPEPILGR